MRIHIGQISPALAEHIGELEKRLDAFGPRTSSLSLHRKEFGSHFFAFVNMDLDSKQYGALRKTLNGVTFRQSKLTVKEAGPSYHDRLTAKRDEPAPVRKLNPEQAKRARAHARRQINVYEGRMRVLPGVRAEQTFRVRIKGELRKPKMRKRKLWGIERRPRNKLVHCFVEGEWRDADGKTVEISEALLDEQAKASRIAAELATSNAYLSDSDFEEFAQTARRLESVESDDEIEVVPRAAEHTTARIPADADDEDASDEDDEEPITSSLGGAARATANKEVPALNTTESLRSALSVESPFTLFGAPTAASPDAGDQTAAAAAAATAAAAAAPSVAAPAVQLAEPKVGLFFRHERSPYLRSLSQAAKLVGTFDSAAWEAEFFEHRGEWNRSLKKRRRDALRMARRMGKKRGEQ